MDVVEYEDASRFCDAVLPHLLEREAENNLMIGIALRLVDGARWGDDPPLMCAIEKQDRVVAAALQTPPYNLQITGMDQSEVALLTDYLRSSGTTLPGVIGPQEAAAAFAACWTAGTNLHAREEKGLGVYQLDRVVPPTQPEGYTEEAAPTDREMLIEWIRDFQAFVGEERENVEAVVDKTLGARHYWLWKDPGPVSLAAFSGPTPNGIRISCVYTPPEHRGKGYASANVAALSQRLMDGGRRFCYLFTDLANPTSNGIYQKIGYRQVCDFASIRFE